jgi:hypothetical protein
VALLLWHVTDIPQSEHTQLSPVQHFTVLLILSTTSNDTVIRSCNYRPNIKSKFVLSNGTTALTCDRHSTIKGYTAVTGSTVYGIVDPEYDKQWFRYYIILRGFECHHTAEFIYIFQHEIKSLSKATSTIQLSNPPHSLFPFKPHKDNSYTIIALPTKCINHCTLWFTKIK